MHATIIAMNTLQKGNAFIGLLLLVSLIGGIGWLILNLPQNDVFAEENILPQSDSTLDESNIELKTNADLFISNSQDTEETTPSEEAPADIASSTKEKTLDQ